MVTKSEFGDEIAGFFSNVSQKKHRRFVHLMKMSHILRLKKNTDWTGQNDHRVNANLKMALPDSVGPSMLTVLQPFCLETVGKQRHV